MNKETAIIEAYKTAIFFVAELEEALLMRDSTQANYSALMREEARAAIAKLREQGQEAFKEEQVARAIVFFLSDTPANDAEYSTFMRLSDTLNDIFLALERSDETADEYRYLAPMEAVTEEGEDGSFEGLILSRGRWSVRYRFASVRNGGRVTRDHRAPWNQYVATITEGPERT